MSVLLSLPAPLFTKFTLFGAICVYLFRHITTNIHGTIRTSPSTKKRATTTPRGLPVTSMPSPFPTVCTQLPYMAMRVVGFEPTRLPEPTVFETATSAVASHSLSFTGYTRTITIFIRPCVVIRYDFQPNAHSSPENSIAARLHLCITSSQVCAWPDIGRA